MHNYSLKLSLLIYCGVLSTSIAHAALTPEQRLIEQIQLGEGSNRDDLIQPALSRLALINPNNPELIAARIRQSLRQRNMEKALADLTLLSQLAPDSQDYRQSKLLVTLATREGMERLQQARALAEANKLPEARLAYDNLFAGSPPSLDLAAEYWQLVSRLPNQQTHALQQLQKIEKQTPGNPKLRYALVKMLFAQGENDQGFALLVEMASVPETKNETAAIWLNQIKSMPVNTSSILYLKSYLDYYPEGQQYNDGQQLLAQQQQQKPSNPDLTAPKSSQSRTEQNTTIAIVSINPAKTTNKNAETKKRRSDILQQQAELFENQQDWQQAIETRQQARRLSPDDIWLTYHLARDLQRVGQSQQADQLFSALSTRQPSNREVKYAYALYLSSSNRDSQALELLNTLPKSQWDNNIKELAQRLQTTTALDQANKMRDQGDEKAAIHYLQQQPTDNRIDLTLAEWAATRQDYQTAHHIYQKLLEQNSDNQEAILGDAEAYIAQGEKEAAKRQLAFFDEHPANALYLERRIANAWRDLDDLSHANKYYQSMYQTLQDQTPSADNALIWRDIADAQQQNHQPQQALNSYRQAMVGSGITTTLPKDNEEFTRLTRNNPDDDWLKRGIRANAGELYQQQNTTVTLDYDRWGSSGTPGISDLTAQTTMLQVDTPFYDGSTFFRTDLVLMNAGTFGNGVYNETFGTCHTVGCNSDYSQKTSGTSFAVGWNNKIWNADIGTTPLGFEVVDWVGGISYKTDWENIGWTLTASRRPISSSLLSFAGTKDPRTGTIWGGVRATGPSLGLSYDQGKEHGIWADLSAHQLTGKNVETNQRARLMAGYYYRVINENNREVKVGLSNMLWHYQKDLSNYSLGQGGYYSPQRYFSVGIPVSYRQRTENWSWELAGSVSWSTSSTKDQRRYPLRNLIENDLPDIDAIESGSSSSGIGYTSRVLIERRLSSNWSIGAGFDLQKAKDYAPSHSLIYLRYTFADWRGNMDMPPQPLKPYADFK